jgi:hypothetical protein
MVYTKTINLFTMPVIPFPALACRVASSHTTVFLQNMSEETNAQNIVAKIKTLSLESSEY